MRGIGSPSPVSLLARQEATKMWQQLDQRRRSQPLLIKALNLLPYLLIVASAVGCIFLLLILHWIPETGPIDPKFDSKAVRQSSSARESPKVVLSSLVQPKSHDVSHEKGVTPSPADLAFLRDELLGRIRMHLQMETMMTKLLGGKNNAKEPEEPSEKTRIFIVGSWESGASYLGEVVATAPGVYYTDEPLALLSPYQIRGGPVAEEANFMLTEMLNCRYDTLERSYMEQMLSAPRFYTSNQRLLGCVLRREVCSDVPFLQKACQIFPKNVVKEVRYRLESMPALLREESLKDIKIVYAVRDPRAMMLSRKKNLKACGSTPDCSDPKIVCEDLHRDYLMLKELETLYPGKFYIFQYEDLVLKKFEAVQALFQWLNLDYSMPTHEHLEKSPISPLLEKLYKRGPLESKSEQRPLMIEMTAADVPFAAHVQEVCKESLELWRYSVASKSELEKAAIIPPFFDETIRE